ncbi:MAG: hypothetical protein PUB90_01195 [bacterium]|nr:hypothetical protein [bacterium]
MIIIFMYKDRGNLKKQMKSLMLWTSIYALVSFIFVNKNYGIIQYLIIIGIVRVMMYGNVALLFN